MPTPSPLAEEGAGEEGKSYPFFIEAPMLASVPTMSE